MTHCSLRCELSAGLRKRENLLLTALTGEAVICYVDSTGNGEGRGSDFSFRRTLVPSIGRTSVRRILGSYSSPMARRRITLCNRRAIWDLLTPAPCSFRTWSACRPAVMGRPRRFSVLRSSIARIIRSTDLGGGGTAIPVCQPPGSDDGCGNQQDSFPSLVHRRTIGYPLYIRPDLLAEARRAKSHKRGTRRTWRERRALGTLPS